MVKGRIISQNDLKVLESMYLLELRSDNGFDGFVNRSKHVDANIMPTDKPLGATDAVEIVKTGPKICYEHRMSCFRIVRRICAALFLLLVGAVFFLTSITTRQENLENRYLRSSCFVLLAKIVSLEYGLDKASSELTSLQAQVEMKDASSSPILFSSESPSGVIDLAIETSLVGIHLDTPERSSPISSLKGLRGGLVQFMRHIGLEPRQKYNASHLLGKYPEPYVIFEPGETLIFSFSESVHLYNVSVNFRGQPASYNLFVVRDECASIGELPNDYTECSSVPGDEVFPVNHLPDVTVKAIILKFRVGSAAIIKSVGILGAVARHKSSSLKTAC